MTTEKLEYFKKKTEEELAMVEKEISETGRVDIDKTATEKDEIADRFEAEEEQEDEGRALRARLEEVKSALKKIETGAYGICEVCGKEIEEERLEANSAARTCKKHM